MSERTSPSVRSQSDDSESSDSGVDSLSTSTGNSFPSDYMDLDEFLSVSNQRCPGSAPIVSSNTDNRNYVTVAAAAAASVNHSNIEVPGMCNLQKNYPDQVNSVVDSVVSPKMSPVALRISPVIFQSLSDAEPTATNAIIQWCRAVGASRSENQAMVPEPGRLPVKRRRNSKYIYNPQPISKKAERKFVSQAKKDEKYWERRIKNNVAAKRSRDLRRQKEIEVTQKYKELERENARLKVEVQKLRVKAYELEQKLAQFQNSNM